MDDLDEVDKETLDFVLSSTDNRYANGNSESEQAEVVLTLIDIDSEPDFTVVEKSVTCRAHSTLPDIVYVKECSRGNKGVFAKKEIPSKTRFGPIDAPLTTKDNLNPQIFLIKLKTKLCNHDNKDLYYDLTNNNFCNWLSLVNPAIEFLQQNLCAHQVGESVYFTSIRTIHAHEELNVWYTPAFAKYVGHNTLIPTKLIDAPNLLENNQLPLPQVPLKSNQRKMALQMKIYLEAVHNERKERSVPPKKRGWKQSGKDSSIVGYTNEKKKKVVSTSEKTDDTNNTVKMFGKNDGKNKHECSICGKGFKRLDKLKQHLVVHTDERNYLCHKCGKTFRRKDKLNHHIKTAFCHKKALEKPKSVPKATTTNAQYNCKKCNIGFNRRGMYVNHMIKQHPDIKIASLPELKMPILKKVKDFLCPYCDKVYKSSAKRKEHILKKHPGKTVPPSIRSILKDNSSSEVNQQARIDSTQLIEIEPIKCPFCERQYSCRGKMKSHVQDKHSNLDLPVPDSTTVTDICNNLTSLSDGNNSMHTSIAYNVQSKTPNGKGTENALTFTFSTQSSNLEDPVNSTTSEKVINSINSVYAVNSDQPKLNQIVQTDISQPLLSHHSLSKLNQPFFNTNVSQPPTLQNSAINYSHHTTKLAYHHMHPRKQLLQALDQERHLKSQQRQFFEQNNQQAYTSNKFMQSDFSAIGINRENQILVASPHERNLEYTEISAEFTSDLHQNLPTSSVSGPQETDTSHTQLIQAILENDTTIDQLPHHESTHTHQPSDWF